MSEIPIINRDLNWLSFNERVLQEAESPDVPLLERLKFLGIYSNNLDEFFRVRVATIKRLMDFGKVAKDDLGISPAKLMEKIQEKLKRLQIRYEKAYHTILKDLEKENIFIINEKQLSKEQGEFVREYFQNKVRLEIFPIMIDTAKQFPVLQDSSIYLAVRFYKQSTTRKYNYSLIEVPTGTLSRFLVLPATDKKTSIIFLDDVIRYNLKDIFHIYDFDKIEAYTIKFTRDAELDIDNDVSISFVESMELSLKRRKTAEALRFVFDEQIPKEFLDYLTRKMGLNKKTHLVGGGRYHNFKDFMRFPVIGKKAHWYQFPPHTPHPDLYKAKSILDKMREKDILLYFPYHAFDYFLDLLREAAIDPYVSHIRVTLYRVAGDSHVIKSLITALHNGKDVTVIIELKARFDEEANIFWANKLREAGARVITGINELKVHSKLCLITRREKGKKVYYACMGTGNLHEKTARIYTDAMLLTSDQSITKEARAIFDFFNRNFYVPKLQKLLVAPFNLRSKLIQLINREIRYAKEGKPAAIFIKMNNLVDDEMIQKFYQASKAGVQIRFIIRGICSLVPQQPGYSENIEAISIVDKYLEHTRIFIFHNNGNKEYFIGSADLMARNLDHRVELVCPITEPRIQRQLQDIMDIQWQDNQKARLYTLEQNNTFKRSNTKPLKSQDAVYDYWSAYFQKKVKK
jgi:polyphosphate kinase